jgi:two-component system, chemotaxis family, chemotaxis protein CheY
MCAEQAPTILLIDNSLEFTYLIDRYGAEGGCRIDHAATIEEAWSYLEQNSPQALLLNLLLPVNAGWCFLESVKGDESFKGIPVIVFSSIRDEERARSAGANSCLWKPIMYADFQAALWDVGVLRSPATDR